jgi:hypothetical protein
LRNHAPCQHNWVVTMNGNEMAAPQPVPDLTPGPYRSEVTDEDRNRFGLLLDHAAERGLLSPADYQVRLAELAEADSIEELQRIVTELPAFGATPGMSAPSPQPAAVPGGPPAPELDAALWASLTPAAPRRGRGNPWLVLLVVVAILVVALAGLALVASHVIHTHAPGAAGSGTTWISSLRL